MNFLFFSNRCHGALKLSSIAVVLDPYGNLRGKLVDLASATKLDLPTTSAKEFATARKEDFARAISMIQRNLDVIPKRMVKTSQYSEMKYLYRYFILRIYSTPAEQQ